MNLNKSPQNVPSQYLQRPEPHRGHSVPAAGEFDGVTRDWWWSANHLQDMRLPVVTGLSQVRLLVGALDGESWPWTAIGTGGEAWFQVLGTRDACIIELGGNRRVMRVAHAYRPDASRHLLPAGCRWWVKTCRADEVFTADRASSIGIRHLLGYPFRKNLVPHEVRPGRPGSRR